MKTALKIYLRAQAIYALLTLPALFMPLIWLISEGLALLWGFVGLAAFLPVIPILRAARVRMPVAAILLVLIAGLAATFLAVWFACDGFDSGSDPLQAMLEMWMFPAAAFTACAVSVITYHRSIAVAVRGESEVQLSNTISQEAAV